MTTRKRITQSRRRRDHNVRVVKQSGRCLQIRYTDPNTGELVRVSSGTTDMEKAERKAREIEARLVLGVKPQKRRREPTAVITWEDFRRAYTDNRLVTMRIKSAIDAENRLDFVEKILKPNCLEDVANTQALEQLQNELFIGTAARFERPRSTATVRGYMKSIMAALNWAARKGWISGVPKIEIPSMEDTDDMKGRPLVGEEVDRLLLAVQKIVGQEAATSWDYLLRGVLCSGLRLTELMHISWDIPQTIQPVWRRGRLPVLWFPAHLQKNKKTQEIPLCPWFEELLEETPVDDRTGWIFNPQSLQHRMKRPAPERLTAERVGKIVTKIGKEAKIIVDQGNPRTGSPVKFASTHDLRRTFAQKLADSDLPEELTAKLMRHADIRTTKRYYQVPNVQRDAGKIRDILGHTVPAGAHEKIDASACAD